MTKLKNTTMALALFAEAANKQAQAVEQGDYKTANRNSDKIYKAVAFLKNENTIDHLKILLTSPLIGVRLWSSSFLLSLNEKQAIKILEEIKKVPGIHSLTAETTLIEWKKGNLKY